MEQEKNLLATRASIPPDIPVLTEPLLLSLLSDLRGRDPLIVTVVPLADVLGHGDLGVARRAVCVGLFSVGGPGERILET